jgi:P27 family predicted phage terminase small subunit
MPTPKKPTRLKVIEGTFRRDRLPVREPSPAGLLGIAPEYFTDQQRALWDRCREESPPGLLTACDRGIFEGYVVLLAARAECVRLWNNSGGTVLVRSTDHERVVVNPYLKEIRRLTEQLRVLEGELGYTPAARSRIDLGEAAPPERLAKYLA